MLTLSESPWDGFFTASFSRSINVIRNHTEDTYTSATIDIIRIQEMLLLFLLIVLNRPPYTKKQNAHNNKSKYVA